MKALRRKPEPIDDGDPAPALITIRRFAARLEAARADLARIAGELLALEVYLGAQPDRPPPIGARTLSEVAGGLTGDCEKLARLRGGVLAGLVEIVAGRDETTWRATRPILAAIEARNGEAVSRQPSAEPEAAPDGEPPRHWDVFLRGLDHDRKFIGTMWAGGGADRARRRALDFFPELKSAAYHEIEVLPTPKDRAEPEAAPPPDSAAQVGPGRPRGKRAGKKTAAAVEAPEGPGGEP